MQFIEINSDLPSEVQVETVEYAVTPKALRRELEMATSNAVKGSRNLIDFGIATPYAKRN